MSGWRRLLDKTPIDESRWVVVDVETTGLDSARDRLLAIGAIALAVNDGTPRIRIGDSFEVVLRQASTVVDKPNILLHKIGVGAQREGVEPAVALEAFERWLGPSPLMGFNSAFDENVILRAMQATLGRRPPQPWMDLAHLAEALFPDMKARSLDEWMDHYGITCAVRHQAAADALATAELLLKLLPAARSQGIDVSYRELARLAGQRKWLRL
jgi:DNA polymerase-3 subunit epsilon